MEFLDYLYGLVQSVVDNSEAGRLVFILLITGAAFIFFLALMLLFSWIFRPEKGRLRELTPAPILVGEHRKEHMLDRMIASRGEKHGGKPSATRSRFQNMLVMAGYRSPGAITVFYGIRLLAMFILPLLALWIGGVVLGLSTAAVFLVALAGFIVGLVMPALILERKMKNRQRQLRRGLPDALDLLVVCTEAGLGLKGGLQKVAEDLYISHPELGEELALVNAQTRVGIDNVAALKDLADRTGIPEMRSLVAALSQSIRFGTDLASTLRVYSEEIRDKRVQAAEEAAAMVSTKMLFPLVLCVFPSFLLVALGPPVLGAMAALAR
jgi:tight adherence protein C